MPLSSLLFRKKPDAASASCKPPQQLMHRASPPPPLLLPAVAFTNLPLVLGLKTIVADAHILGGDDRHHYVRGSSVYFPSPSSACSSSFASSFMSPPSPTRSYLGAGVLDREVDEEDYDQTEKGGNSTDEEEEEAGEERGGNELDDERFCWASYGKRSGFRRLPPPISVLAKAGEKRCLMPWVLRRSYEVGGRLVMREVKVEHQEYLKPCRAGGRLTLKLVHLQEPEPSVPSTPAQAKSPTAPVPVPASSSTPRSRRQTEIPTLSMQSPPRTLPRSSSEKKVGRTGNPKTAAWRPVWSREDSGVDMQRRRGALTMATLSSSLPEASTIGCYANARPDSLFGLMTAARMPPVHS